MRTRLATAPGLRPVLPHGLPSAWARWLSLGSRWLSLGSRWLSLGSRWLSLGSRWLPLVLLLGAWLGSAAARAAPAAAPVNAMTKLPAGKGAAVPGPVPLAGAVTAAELPSGLTPSDVLAMSIDRAERRCLSRTVGRAELVGCRDSRCASPGLQRKILSLTDLLDGQVIRPGMLQRAGERLVKLGFFRTISVDCRVLASSGDAVLRWQVTIAEVVRSVAFEGNSAIFQDELRNKLLIRPGDVLGPDTPEGRLKLQGQKETLQNLYQRNGFDDARVDIEAKVVRPGEVRVWIRIAEGERKRITDRKLVIAPLEEPGEAADKAGLYCRPIG